MEIKMKKEPVKNEKWRLDYKSKNKSWLNEHLVIVGGSKSDNKIMHDKNRKEIESRLKVEKK